MVETNIYDKINVHLQEKEYDPSDEKLTPLGFSKTKHECIIDIVRASGVSTQNTDSVNLRIAQSYLENMKLKVNYVMSDDMVRIGDLKKDLNAYLSSQSNRSFFCNERRKSKVKAARELIALISTSDEQFDTNILTNVSQQVLQLLTNSDNLQSDGRVNGKFGELLQKHLKILSHAAFNDLKSKQESRRCKELGRFAQQSRHRPKRCNEGNLYYSGSSELFSYLGESQGSVKQPLQ